MAAGVPLRWRMLFVLFAARTAMAFQFQSLAAVSPLLIADLALEFALFGSLVGIWMLPGTFAAIPGGALGQRFGEKRIVVAGLALMVAGTLAIAAADGHADLLLGRLASGVGAVMLNVLLTKMAADWFAERELATAMAVLVSSWPLGIGLALVLLGPLAVQASWPFAMNVTAGICAAALVAIARAYHPPAASAGPEPNTSITRLSARESVLVCAAGIVWGLFNVAYILVVSFTPALLGAAGIPAASSALLVSLATWPLLLTVPIGGWLADRTGRGNAIIYLSFLGMAACMATLLGAGSPLVMLTLFGIFAGPCAGPIMALPARALRPQSRSLGMGIYYTWYYAAMALLPPVAGLLRDVTRVPAAPLLFGAALLALAAAAVYFFNAYFARRP